MLLGGTPMPRKTGDANYSVRERRLIAAKKIADAKLDTLKAKLEYKDAQLKELKAKQQQQQSAKKPARKKKS